MSFTSSSSPVKGHRALKNSNYYKIKFARGFLRSLTEINKRDYHKNNHNNNISSASSSSSSSSASSCYSSTFSLSSSPEIRKRSEMIKLAAYSSMSSAIGPRKAWTRALLTKLRKRPSFVVRKRSSFSLKMMIKNKKFKRKRAFSSSAYKAEMSRENIAHKTEKLREIVPGGKDMDICSLFEETAHFIKCLSMQVQIMQDIANQLSK